MIQLIEKQPLKIGIKDNVYTMVRLRFYKNKDFRNPIEPKIKGSQLVWYIGGHEITYNQIKKWKL